MRVYRACWTAAIAAITGTAVVAAAAFTSAWIILAQIICVGGAAVAFGATWEEDPGKRWRAARVWGLRGAVAAIVLTGLPALIGSWSLLVLVAMGATTPDVVLAARRLGWRRHVRAASPVRELSDDALARRWTYTSTAVRSTWRAPAAVLPLVEERQRLLDELERRDPEGFAHWLVTSGWSQPQKP